MKVRIKTFDVEMEAKNNGVEFEVRSPDDKTQLGDCYVTKTGLTWCAGKVAKKNGVVVSWENLIALCKSDDAMKAALKAAKAAT